MTAEVLLDPADFVVLEVLYYPSSCFSGQVVRFGFTVQGRCIFVHCLLNVIKSDLSFYVRIFEIDKCLVTVLQKNDTCTEMILGL